MRQVGSDPFKKGHGGNYCVFTGDQMVLLKASGALEKAHIVSVTYNDESSFHVMNIMGTEVHFFKQCQNPVQKHKIA